MRGPEGDTVESEHQEPGNRRNEFAPDVIDLSGVEPLVTSRNHKIFQHPFHDDTLVKVRHGDDEARPGMIRFAEWRYGPLRQWDREAREYLAALNRGCPEIWRLARFMGYARTTEGPALLAEKLTGADGNIATTLLDEVRSFAPDARERQILHREAMELMDDLKRGRIIVGDLHGGNIVRARERGGRLAIIDGLGERVLFQISVISERAFHASIERRRQRLSDIVLKTAQLTNLPPG